MEWVSEQRAHSIGSAAAAALVAPLVRVLSSAISSTMCAASENTAAFRPWGENGGGYLPAAGADTNYREGAISISPPGGASRSRR